STPLNDRSETEALKAALGNEDAHRIPISSTKSAIGHLLGAAGAVEAIATVEALRRRLAPPTVGWEERDPELDLDYVPGEARARPSWASSSPAALASRRGTGRSRDTAASSRRASSCPSELPRYRSSPASRPAAAPTPRRLRTSSS